MVERGGVLVERRFLRTRSRCPSAVERDWGGLRRKSLMVRPRILIYPRRMAFRRVVLEGEPRAWEMYVVKEASLRLVTGGGSGVDGEGSDQWR